VHGVAERRRVARNGDGRERPGRTMTLRPAHCDPLTVAVGTILAAAVALSGCATTGSGSVASATAASKGARPSASESRSDPSPLPADLDAGPRASCMPDIAPGWLRRENARPGFSLAVPPTNTAANLYLDTVSATCGQVVRVAVSAPEGSYRLRVVRVAWYGGAGGRVVTTSGPFRARRQPDAPGTGHARTPGWFPSASLTVARTWPPGMYLVQLMSGSTAVQAAPLVVLTPGGAHRASLLFIVPAMTWTAYTGFGGRSLYRNWSLQGARAHDDRARTADVARPIEGPGVYAVHRYTTPLVRAAERAGVDIDYVADLDVDRTPSLVSGRAGLVTGSHTEYVTRRIYDTFEAARDRGTNLAFLGGNGFYWQARITRDAALRPVSVTVYRRAAEDPLRVSSPALTTVLWRDAPLSRPEAGLLGAQYSGLGVVVPLVILHAPGWLSWRQGQIVTAGAASEVDAAVPGISPHGVAVLAAGGAAWQGQHVEATITYYAAPSGAAVFDAGSVFAGCSTENSCQAISVPAATRDFWSGTIVHVVRGFAVPRFGATHPAPAQGTIPTYAQLLARYGRAVMGTSIAGGD
jgi:hypothetical protein